MIKHYFEYIGVIAAGVIGFLYLKDKLRTWLFGDIINEQKKIIQEQNEIILGQMRLQLLQMLDHRPNKVEQILKLYDEYIKRGGNSYIKNLIADWKKSIGK